jgi:energy-converting hydrogenase Eha subunit B
MSPATSCPNDELIPPGWCHESDGLAALFEAGTLSLSQASPFYTGTGTFGNIRTTISVILPMVLPTYYPQGFWGLLAVFLLVPGGLEHCRSSRLFSRLEVP